MRVAVLGRGAVGRALAGRLEELGHDVHVGTRSDDSYAAAAEAGELVVNATNGAGSLEALEAARGENLAGKVLLDLANVIERGPDGVEVGFRGRSLAEEIQLAHPQARVVKALNTMNAEVMVHPAGVAGEHVVFLCGDDAEAKAIVGDLLESFGWPRPRQVDLGPLRAARGTEAYLGLWLAIMSSVGHGAFNVQLCIRDAGSSTDDI